MESYSMNCSGPDKSPPGKRQWIDPESPPCWIIGYGNPQRRDDGIGPFIVNRLMGLLKDERHIRLLALDQLEPDIVDKLQHAGIIIFVDATIHDSKRGWDRIRIGPAEGALPYLTHHVDPYFILALLQTLYHRHPQTWLVSVRGSDFDYGEGLAPEVEKIAEEVVLEILGFLSSKGLTKRNDG